MSWRFALAQARTGATVRSRVCPSGVSDAYGGTRAGFSATAEISRKEFGVSFDAPLEGGGVLVGDKITISLEIEAVLRAPQG